MLHHSISPQPPRSFCTTFLDPPSWNLEQATCISNVFFTLNLNSMKSCFPNSVLNLMKSRFTNSVRNVLTRSIFSCFQIFCQVSIFNQHVNKWYNFQKLIHGFTRPCLKNGGFKMPRRFRFFLFLWSINPKYIFYCSISLVGC